LGAVAVSAALAAAGSASAFDGATVTAAPAPPVAAATAAVAIASRAKTPAAAKAAAPLTALQAFESARIAYHDGDKAAALTSLEFAATHGHAGAQWMLGRLYAAGAGVAHDDTKAFDYFRDVVRRASSADFVDTREAAADAPYVSSALVWLGSYYLEGIPGSDVKPNPKIALHLFTDAAYNYGDPNAEYNLARMYLDGTDVTRNSALAVRWLNLAAAKGHAPSRALLGHILFKGDIVPKQAERGLMLMTLASQQAEKSGLASDKWMIDLHEKALAEATADQRTGALSFLDHWLKSRPEK
jgi:TPR repeat protein